MRGYKYYKIIFDKSEAKIIASNQYIYHNSEGEDSRKFGNIELACNFLAEIEAGKICQNLEYFKKEYRFRAYGKEFSELKGNFKSPMTDEMIEIFYVNNFNTVEQIKNVSKEDLDSFGEEFYWDKDKVLKDLYD